jgi:Sortase domain
LTRHAAGGRVKARHAAGWPETRIALATLAAGVAVITVGAASLALARGSATAAPPPAAWLPAPAGPVAGVPWLSAAGPVAAPVQLTVPAIGVRTTLVRLGLTPSGTLQVPGSFTVAGWYDGSPRPGAPGSAIIAGHIDSQSGPAVFYRLASLHPGDRAYIRRADGTLAVFRITAVRTYPKDRFPTAAVYGPAPGPQLRLITCGGTFDPTLGSYLSNVVVYAIEV